jgi:hypothetical protein
MRLENITQPNKGPSKEGLGETTQIDSDIQLKYTAQGSSKEQYS